MNINEGQFLILSSCVRIFQEASLPRSPVPECFFAEVS